MQPETAISILRDIAQLLNRGLEPPKHGLALPRFVELFGRAGEYLKRAIATILFAHNLIPNITINLNQAMRSAYNALRKHAVAKA